MTRRRMAIWSAAGIAAAGAAGSLFHANHQLPASDAAAERRFRQLQDALLARHGVPARSLFGETQNPPLHVHVIEAGKGEPVVFIHGGNSVAASWTPLLAKLRERYHIYAPDRPGCGLTTKFLYPAGVSLRAHAVAFVGSVLDRLSLARPAIVGNSMGGYFGLVFALMHPRRVSKLVLIGEPAGSAPKSRLVYRLIGTRVLNSALFATVMKPGSQTVRRGFENLLVADIRRVTPEYLDCMTAGAVIPGAVQSWITLVENAYDPPGGGLFSGSSTLTYKLRPELPNLAVPTLLLWGEKDAFGAPSLGLEMAALMKNARCEVIPDAGHVAWLDQLNLCAEKLESFLG
jgi:pimeloyl-ACP methyl ester carboxylesterase